MSKKLNQDAENIRNALDLICLKWHPHIICFLYEGRMRFNQLQSEIGISSRMLAKGLRRLRRDGLVEYDGGRNYYLTEKGRDMKNALRPLASWQERHSATNN